MLLMHFINKLLIVDNFFFFQSNYLTQVELILLKLVAITADFVLDRVEQVLSTIEFKDIGVFLDVETVFGFRKLVIFEQFNNLIVYLFPHKNIINFDLSLVNSIDAVYDSIDFVEIVSKFSRSTDKFESFVLLLNNHNSLLQLIISEFVDDEIHFEFFDF